MPDPIKNGHYGHYGLNGPARPKRVRHRANTIMHLRKFIGIALLLPFLLVGGCSLIFPPEDPSGIRRRDAESTRVFGKDGAPSGHVAVVYLNHGAALVQMITSVSYPDQPPIVWVTAVAPNSWDSLVLECGFNQVAVLRGIPVSLETGLEGATTDLQDPVFVAGTDIDCGSILVADINDPANPGTGPSLDITLQTIPEKLDPDGSPTQSALAPGSGTDLILLRIEPLEGTPLTMTTSWESDSGLVSVTGIRVGDGGPGIASLIECPVVEIGWGDVTDPNVPGAIVTNNSDTNKSETGQIKTGLSAPAPLTLGNDFNCGNIVTFRAIAGDSQAAELQLSTEVGGAEFAELPDGGLDLFGNIRKLINQEGFAGRLSNDAALLPAPNKFEEGSK